MTKDEALDLALEALEKSARNWPSDSVIQAITAIKQARSAPVQEPVAWEYTTSYVPNPDRDNGVRVTSELRVAQVNALPGSIKPLGYTTPPAAQRQWQSLTDDEMHACWDSPLTPLGMKHARMIEAKLKEKNT
jgi:hypothetical protein